MKLLKKRTMWLVGCGADGAGQAGAPVSGGKNLSDLEGIGPRRR